MVIKRTNKNKFYYISTLLSSVYFSFFFLSYFFPSFIPFPSSASFLAFFPLLPFFLYFSHCCHSSTAHKLILHFIYLISFHSLALLFESSSCSYFCLSYPPHPYSFFKLLIFISFMCLILTLITPTIALQNKHLSSDLFFKIIQSKSSSLVHLFLTFYLSLFLSFLLSFFLSFSHLSYSLAIPDFLCEAGCGGQHTSPIIQVNREDKW